MAGLLGGCVPYVTGSTYYDGRFWYSNTKTGMDIAGGPRQDVLVIVDRDGTLIDNTSVSGPGTLQSLAGIFTAVVSAGGQVAGSAVLRPTRNNTTASISGSSTATTGPTSSTSTANPNNPQGLGQ